MSTACHISHKPIPFFGSTTPYEILYKTRPFYSHLGAFGCLCFVASSPQNKDKFQPRSNPCIFLGFPHGKKAYKVLELQTQTVLPSRNVIFHEHVFPFHHLSHTDPSTLPPSVLDMSYIFFPTELNAPPSLIHNSPLHFSTNNFSSAPNSVGIPSTSTQNESPLFTSSSSNIPHPDVRKSTRLHKPPTYLQDYLCSLTTATAFPKSNTHWCNFVSFSSLPVATQMSLSQPTTYFEPQNYEQASKDSNWSLL